MSDMTIIQLLDRQRRVEMTVQPPIKWKWPLLVATFIACVSFLYGVETGMDRRQNTTDNYCKSLSIFSRNPLCHL